MWLTPMAKVEPVFKELKQHLGLLVNQVGWSVAGRFKAPDICNQKLPRNLHRPHLFYCIAQRGDQKTNSLPVFENQVTQKTAADVAAI